MKSQRRLICVDFDGTICLEDKTIPKNVRYKNSEKIYGIPHPLIHDWMHEMHKYHDMIIFTARNITGIFIGNLYEWLKKYDLPCIDVTNVKPHQAVLFIDDRGWMFTGTNYPTPEEVSRFMPWHKQ